MSKEEEKFKKHCHCNSECDDECHCEKDCHCDEHDKCKDDCHCKEGHCSCHGEDHECDCEDCHCDDECECDHCHDEKEEMFECCGCDEHEEESKKTEDKSEQYLLLAKQIQADFENFRRHAGEDVKNARVAGQASVIEVFLPCLDTFKEAKKMISDEKILEGVEMIEEKIIQALESLGVEKIDSIGQIYNPHLHNVIAVMRDEEKENDVILDEYQAGYTFGGKVIRYAKVIVNKKED